MLLAHLSQECNEPELARRSVEEALRGEGFRGVVEVAEQDAPSRLFDVAELVGRTGGRPQLDLFRRAGAR